MTEPTDWDELQPSGSGESEEEIDAILQEESVSTPKPKDYGHKKKFAQGRLALYRTC